MDSEIDTVDSILKEYLDILYYKASIRYYSHINYGSLEIICNSPFHERVSLNTITIPEWLLHQFNNYNRFTGSSSLITHEVYMFYESIPFVLDPDFHPIVNCTSAGEAPEWPYRYRLWSNFDDGIQMDKAAWFEATPEQVALHVGEQMSCSGVIIDGCCGVGASLINFSYFCDLAVGVDLDPERILKTQINAQICGVENVKAIEASIFDFRDLVVSEGGFSSQSSISKLNSYAKQSTTLSPIDDTNWGFSIEDIGGIFVSPPWGGRGYRSQDWFSLTDVNVPNMVDIFNASCDLCPRGLVVMHYPRSVQMSELMMLAMTRGYRILEIERVIITDGLLARGRWKLSLNREHNATIVYFSHALESTLLRRMGGLSSEFSAIKPDVIMQGKTSTQSRSEAIWRLKSDALKARRRGVKDEEEEDEEEDQNEEGKDEIMAGGELFGNIEYTEEDKNKESSIQTKKQPEVLSPLNHAKDISALSPTFCFNPQSTPFIPVVTPQQQYSPTSATHSTIISANAIPFSPSPHSKLSPTASSFNPSASPFNPSSISFLQSFTPPEHIVAPNKIRFPLPSPCLNPLIRPNNSQSNTDGLVDRSSFMQIAQDKPLLLQAAKLSFAFLFASTFFSAFNLVNSFHDIKNERRFSEELHAAMNYSSSISKWLSSYDDIVEKARIIRDELRKQSSSNGIESEDDMDDVDDSEDNCLTKTFTKCAENNRNITSNRVISKNNPNTVLIPIPPSIPSPPQFQSSTLNTITQPECKLLLELVFRLISYPEKDFELPKLLLSVVHDFFHSKRCFSLSEALHDTNAASEFFQELSQRIHFEIKSPIVIKNLFIPVTPPISPLQESSSLRLRDILMPLISKIFSLSTAATFVHARSATEAALEGMRTKAWISRVSSLLECQMDGVKARLAKGSVVKMVKESEILSVNVQSMTESTGHVFDNGTSNEVNNEKFVDSQHLQCIANIPNETEYKADISTQIENPHSQKQFSNSCNSTFYIKSSNISLTSLLRPSLRSREDLFIEIDIRTNEEILNIKREKLKQKKKRKALRLREEKATAAAALLLQQKVLDQTQREGKIAANSATSGRREAKKSSSSNASPIVVGAHSTNNKNNFNTKSKNSPVSGETKRK